MKHSVSRYSITFIFKERNFDHFIGSYESCSLKEIFCEKLENVMYKKVVNTIAIF